MGHLVGVAQLLHGSRRVAAADDGDGVALTQGLGHGLGAGGEGGELKHAHGPVPDDGAGILHGLAVSGDGLGADVHAQAVVGDVHAVHGHGLGVGGKLLGTHGVLGQQQLDALLLGLLHHVVAVVQPVLLQQGLADGAALGLQEGVGHAAADDDGVGDFQQVVDDADLGGHLGAAQDGHQGPLGIGQGAADDLQLLLDQEAGHGGQVVGHAGGGGVGAVDGAKGVGYVNLSHGGHSLGQLGIVLGLALLKAGVLQQHDLAGLQGGGLGLGVGAHHVLGHDHVLAQQLAQAGGHRLQAQGRHHLALGLAHVGAGDHGGILVQQVLDGGQSGPDALVVGDDAAAVLGHGHVKIAAQQDLLAGHINVLYSLLVVVHPVQAPFISPSPVRPGKSSCRSAS